MSDTSTTDVDSQIQAAIAAAMGASGTTTNELLPTPIGVPKYKVDESGEIMKDAQGRPIPWYVQVPEGQQVDTPAGVTTRIEPGSPAAVAGRQVHPRYWSHDAWTLVDAMSAEDVYGVQRQLIDAGLLKPKNVVAGNWTNDEAGAFQQVLSAANASGVTWDVALSHMAANGRANPPSQDKVQRPEVEIHKANPFALGQVADKLSAQLIGRRLSDSERAGFIEWWGQHEDRANSEKVAAANAEANDTMSAGGDQIGGGLVDTIRSGVLGRATPTGQKVSVGVNTLHDEMTPDQAAEEYIRTHNAPEVSNTQQINTFGMFLNAIGTGLGGGVPGRPGG
jgi:hypothetical protein